MRAIISALLLASGLGCGADEATTEPIDAVFAPAEVASWPLVRDCRMSIEHDAQHIVVRVQPSASDAYTNGTYPFAVGTTIVKLLYDDGACTELSGYAVMKRLDHDVTDGGGWLWQDADSNGSVIASGNLKRCVSCHTSCTNGRDMACTDP